MEKYYENLTPAHVSGQQTSARSLAFTFVNCQPVESWETMGPPWPFRQ